MAEIVKPGELGSFICHVPNGGRLTVYRNGILNYVRICKNSPVLFNSPIPGSYTFDGAYKVERTKSKIYEPNFELFPAERIPDYNGSMKILENKSMHHTPARIFTVSGLVEVAPYFKNLPEQYQAFILLHEAGHMFYKDETKTDIYALYNFAKLGFSMSQALYCLVHILKRPNPERIYTIFHLIPKK